MKIDWALAEANRLHLGVDGAGREWVVRRVTGTRTWEVIADWQRVVGAAWSLDAAKAMAERKAR